MRPHQWVKNLFVIAPVVFAGQLFDGVRLGFAAVAFFAFSFTSSAIYLINDVRDVEEDRLHPVKRRRPIASGSLSPTTAKWAAVGLIVCALLLVAFLGFVSGWVDQHVVSMVRAALLFGGCLVSYVALNLLYTTIVKKLPYLDVFSIATGFVLRVLGGSFAAAVEPSRYLLLVTFLLATFLGFGKRMHELVQQGESGGTRPVLGRYSRRVLRDLLIGTGVASVVVYAAYALEADTAARLGTPWMAATTVFTGFGVYRFLRLVLRNDEADSPTEQMLRDKPFLLNLLLWALAIVLLIYLT